MSFVTFIIPTISRETLDRTLRSLVEQGEDDWNAVVVADAVEDFKPPIRDNRIVCLNLKDKLGSSNHGGEVRNQGLCHANGEWIGFVDDDDRLDSEYTYRLKAESHGSDLVVFRMKYPDGAVLPEGAELGCCQVGISFAIRTSFLRSQSLRFGNLDTEDWDFIHRAMDRNARVRISKHIAYYVRH